MGSISVYHLLKRQIPAHIQQQFPLFCKFVEYYYRWLQTIGFVDYRTIQGLDELCHAIVLTDTDVSDQKFFVGHTISNGEALAEIVGILDDNKTLIIRNLREDADFTIGDRIHVRKNSRDEYTKEERELIQTGTISEIRDIPNMFLDHFCKLLDSDNLFGEQSVSISNVLRHISEIYKSKGNEKGIEYIVKVLRGIDADLKYPWDNVLILDGAKWNQPYTITVRSDEEYWQNIPINFSRIRIQSVGFDENYERTYTEEDVTKIEIFGKVSENYDEDVYDLKFPKDDCTNYAEWLYKVEQPTKPEYQYWSRYEHPDTKNFIHDTPLPNSFDSGTWKDPKDTSINGWSSEKPSEYGEWEMDENTGGIKFDSDKPITTYGRFGNRIVTPFIRLYFNHAFPVEVNQEINVMGEDENGKEIIIYRGYVTNGIEKLRIINGGKKWQIGQVFSTSKSDEWKLYKTFGRDDTDKRITIINDYDVPVEYSMEKPLIGRVLGIDSTTGAVNSVEIIQYGDHIPEMGTKTIRVSPQFEGEVLHPDWDMELEITYNSCCRGAGEWEDTRSLIDDNEVRIQDSYYYQQYSYDILANAPFEKYHDLANLFHPVGTQMFSTYEIENDLNVAPNFKIEDGGKFVNLTLFDVFMCTEQIWKTLEKVIRESVSSHDFLTKKLEKPLTDDVGIFDESRKDHGVMYGFDANYDKHDNEDCYFEKTLDGVIKTSYGDSGFTNLLHINYEHHVVADIPVYGRPNIDNQYTLLCIGDDDCTFDYNPTFSVGDEIVVNLTIDKNHVIKTSYRFLDGLSRESIDIPYTVEENGTESVLVRFRGIATNIILVVDNTPGILSVTVENIGHGTTTSSISYGKYNDVVGFSNNPRDYVRPFKPTELEKIEILENNEIVSALTHEPYEYKLKTTPIVVKAYYTECKGGFLTVSLKGVKNVAFSNAETGQKISENDFVPEGTTIDIITDETIEESFYIYDNGGAVNISSSQFQFPNSDIVLCLINSEKYYTVKNTNINVVKGAVGRIEPYRSEFLNQKDSKLVVKGSQRKNTRLDYQFSGWINNNDETQTLHRYDLNKIDNSRIVQDFNIDGDATVINRFIKNGGYVINKTGFKLTGYESSVTSPFSVTEYRFANMDYQKNPYYEKYDKKYRPRFRPIIDKFGNEASLSITDFSARNTSFPVYDYETTGLRNPTTNELVPIERVYQLMDGVNSVDGVPTQFVCTIDSGNLIFSGLNMKTIDVQTNITDSYHYNLQTTNDYDYPCIYSSVITTEDKFAEFRTDLSSEVTSVAGRENVIDDIADNLNNTQNFIAPYGTVIQFLPRGNRPLYDFSFGSRDKTLLGYDRYGNITMRVGYSNDTLRISKNTSNVSVRIFETSSDIDELNYELGTVPNLEKYTVSYKLVLGAPENTDKDRIYTGNEYYNKYTIPVIGSNNLMRLFVQYRDSKKKSSISYKPFEILCSVYDYDGNFLEKRSWTGSALMESSGIVLETNKRYAFVVVLND